MVERLKFLLNKVKKGKCQIIDRVGYMHDYYDPDAVEVFTNALEYPHMSVVFEPSSTNDNKYVFRALDIRFSPCKHIYIPGEEKFSEEEEKIIKEIIRISKGLAVDWLRRK